MDIEGEIVTIKERNARVELDKAWEVSSLRIGIVSAVTYLLAALTLWMIDAARPWLTALVPTLGFALSTFSIPPIKHWWIRRRSER